MTKLAIEGMTCQHCVKAVDAELAKVPGVTKVDVSLENNSAIVEGQADNAALIAAVAEAGYEAKVA